MTEHDPSQRHYMSRETHNFIMGGIEREPLVDQDRLSEFDKLLSEAKTLKPWAVVYQFTQLFKEGAHELLWGDLGILRPCLGIEHATAVLTGLEKDYAYLFEDDRAVLRILRWTALLQDSGKTLAVAKYGDSNNDAQTAYNVAVAKNILSAPCIHHTTRQAVPLLIGQDIIGGILQGKDISRDQVRQLRAAWPELLKGSFDDCMVIAYLADASAHSAFRTYRSLHTGQIERAVQPDDAQLTFLFKKHPSGPVTLTDDRCDIVRGYFPYTSAVTHLLTGQDPFMILPRQMNSHRIPHPADVFTETVLQKMREGSARPSDENPNHSYLDVATPYPLAAYPLRPRVILAAEAEQSDWRHGPASVLITRDTTHDYFRVIDGDLWYKRLIGKQGEAELILHPNPLRRVNTHGDEFVKESIQNLYETIRYEQTVFGSPLGDKSAWNIIHWIQDSIIPSSEQND